MIMAKKARKSAKKKPPASASQPLVLKRQTVADLKSLISQTARVRQSRKVCIA
jgi:hypothetical protein